MDVRSRLSEFLKSLNISRKSFEMKCGLSNDFVDKAGEGDRQLALDKILVAYPELNMLWLRTGYGDMLISHDIEKDMRSVQSLYAR